MTSPKATLPPEGLSSKPEALRESYLNHIAHTRGKHPSAATKLDQFYSVARTARDRMFDDWTRTMKRHEGANPRRVYYLSMEYLLGRLFVDSCLNLGIYGDLKKALEPLDIDVEELGWQEPDAGLGNGGLGRLAACFLDSMASLGIPGTGYGIRYEYGIFRQDIVDGRQVERPDDWLSTGCPWTIRRPERVFTVKFGGRVISYTGPGGRPVHEWVDTNDVRAMANDMPVPGYRNGVVNTLRLWSAKASSEFAFEIFNRGDYVGAVHEQALSENISKVLYPNENVLAGKELRLKQEYFICSATLQDCLRRHLAQGNDIRKLHEKAVFQLNDTHPALAVAELMRLLVDEHKLSWDEAWNITRQSVNYTNHTVLPEALEQWPVWLLERVLPRHLQIIYEINTEFLRDVRERFQDDDLVRRVSLVAEGDEKKIRMAHLAIAASTKVNGVSALHSDILKNSLFADFEKIRPGLIINQTNGVTPRRWILNANPALSTQITKVLGTDKWVSDLDLLKGLEKVADDAKAQAAFAEIKHGNKQRLATWLKDVHGFELNPNHLVDTQIKRIHEYKRQTLNILHVVSRYLQLKANPNLDVVPRTWLFGGKAAPGYDTAKRIIHLINSVAGVVNHDPATRDKLQVFYVPNYSVSAAELMIPATDLSEQISTAGMEASGTGNMKFAMNGALTIGTLDGANVEMMEHVGAENIFIFGLTAEQVLHQRAVGYDPKHFYNQDSELRMALDAIGSGMFSHGDGSAFRPLIDNFLYRDFFLVLADYRAYANCQKTVDAAYRDQKSWMHQSILNIARMGFFSSDRTIRGYAEDVWKVKPL